MENQIYARADEGLNTFYAKVYGFMGMGVGLSALVSFMMLTVEALRNHMVLTLTTRPYMLFIILFAEIGLVVAASRSAAKNSPMALPLFLFYSVVNGYTLSFIIARYTGTTVYQALISASIMFMVMAVVGKLTKKDLSGIGRACYAGVIGIIIASVVNFFMQSPAISYAISIIGVIIFSGLIAWDNQRIRLVYEQSNGNVPRGWAISLALHLYLDFINLFLFLLRIFGSGRSN